ncbi:MAG: 4Fe-4S cluster-binding domain-containing protein [Candidatus Heimdallarchaeota archaeon]
MSEEVTKQEIDLGNQGHIVEIFSSFQGEGGSVKGSCFGKRQIFVRLAGCTLKCAWCDSADSRDPDYPECKVEIQPGTWEFTTYKNPVDIEFIIQQIIKLRTKDFHSVSLTGGEPPHQEEFFYRLVNRLYDLEIPSYACVDIKDRSARSVKNSQWEKLIDKEIESMDILQNNSAKIFAKLVVTEETRLDDVRMFAERLRDIVVPIVIQPVTPLGGVGPISNKKLFKITETLAEVLPTEMFGLSIQGHKLVNLL